MKKKRTVFLQHSRNNEIKNQRKRLSYFQPFLAGLDIPFIPPVGIPATTLASPFETPLSFLLIINIHLVYELVFIAKYFYRAEIQKQIRTSKTVCRISSVPVCKNTV